MTMTNDAFVLKIDLERLRDRLRRNDARCADMTHVRAWLRENRFCETTYTDIWISFADRQHDVLHPSEVVSRKVYA
jgi:hypothetical protein